LFSYETVSSPSARTPSPGKSPQSLAITLGTSYPPAFTRSSLTLASQKRFSLLEFGIGSQD